MVIHWISSERACFDNILLQYKQLKCLLWCFTVTKQFLLRLPNRRDKFFPNFLQLPFKERVPPEGETIHSLLTWRMAKLSNWDANLSSFFFWAPPPKKYDPSQERRRSIQKSATDPHLPHPSRLNVLAPQIGRIYHVFFWSGFQGFLWMVRLPIRLSHSVNIHRFNDRKWRFSDEYFSVAI